MEIHIVGNLSDGGIWVCRCIVEQLRDGLSGGLGALGLG
jgi:hypothetical protein